MATTDINVGIFPVAVQTWLPYLAIKEGFFKANHINATMVPVTNATTDVSALASGSLDLAVTDASAGVGAIQKGIGLKLVSSVTTLGLDLIAPASENLPKTFPASVRALKGKSVGVIGIGTPAYYYARLWIAAAGLSPDDVNYVALNGPQQTIAAAASGQTAAVVVDPVTGYLFSRALHAQLLATNSKPFPGLPAHSLMREVMNKPGAWLWTSTQFASSHPQAVREIQLALEETDVWVHNPANFDTAATAIAAQPGFPTTVIPESQLPTFIKPLLPTVESYVSQGDANAYVKFWKQEGLLKRYTPASSYFVHGVPESAKAVVKAVRSAGKAKLGKSA